MHTGNILEHEDHDRSDLNLPGNQLQLLQDAADMATSECDQSFKLSLGLCIHDIVLLDINFLHAVTVLVLYNAGPLDVSWAVSNNKVVSILESFFPAQVIFWLIHALWLYLQDSDFILKI